MRQITLQLRPETERKLRDRAAEAGTTIESFLEQIAENSADGTAPTSHDVMGGVSPAVAVVPRYISEPHLTDEEFQRVLDGIAAGPRGVPLPPDFSRADIYDDHD